jgi:hypothetical protein
MNAHRITAAESPVHCWHRSGSLPHWLSRPAWLGSK